MWQAHIGAAMGGYRNSNDHAGILASDVLGVILPTNSGYVAK